MKTIKPEYTTLKQWIIETHTQSELSDILTIGVPRVEDDKWNAELVELYDVYKAEIWEMLLKHATDAGLSILYYIASDNVTTTCYRDEHLKHLLVAWAIEKVVQQINQNKE